MRERTHPVGRPSRSRHRRRHGAVLVDADHFAFGLGFAGVVSASDFFPMRQILDALGVDLVTEALWLDLICDGETKA